jgi:hypothetical protein
MTAPTLKRTFDERDVIEASGSNELPGAFVFEPPPLIGKYQEEKKVEAVI